MPRATPKPLVVATGLVCLDIICRGSEAPVFHAGGTAGNVAANLAWFGWKSVPVARLGADEDATAIVADMSSVGVDVRLLRTDAAANTPRILEMLPPSPVPGRPTHTFHQRCRNCGEWYPQFRPFVQDWAPGIIAAAPRPKVFFTDRAFPAAAILAEHYAKTGALIVFEPNSARLDRSARRILEVADIVKVSSDRVSGDEFSAHTGLLIETQGAEGLWYTWRGQTARVPASVARDVIDTAGAGDMLTAAFLDALQRSGIAWNEAKKNNIAGWLNEAQAMASAKCAFVGARGATYRTSPTKFRALAKNAATSVPSTSTATREGFVACRVCDWKTPSGKSRQAEEVRA